MADEESFYDCVEYVEASNAWDLTGKIEEVLHKRRKGKDEFRHLAMTVVAKRRTYPVRETELVVPETREEVLGLWLIFSYSPAGSGR